MHAILLILFVLLDFIVADRFIFLIYFLFVAEGPHAHSIFLKSLPRLYYCYKAATIEDNNNLGNLLVVWGREFTKHMNPQLEFFGKPEKLLDWWCLKWTSLSDVKRGIHVFLKLFLRWESGAENFHRNTTLIAQPTTSIRRFFHLIHCPIKKTDELYVHVERVFTAKTTTIGFGWWQ